MLAVSLVFARLVVEPSTPVPRLADDSVLLIQRHAANLGCPPSDPPDAGVDAGTSDAGPTDAGTDAGAGSDAGCEPIVGEAVSMIVRPRFTGDGLGSRFALLFVTPSRPVVETVPDPFPDLVSVTAPKTEIHVTEIQDPALGKQCGGGCSFETAEPPSLFDPPDVGDGGLGDGAVNVETVGPYEVVRVQPADPAELSALLSSFNYVVQQDDLAALSPYIAAGYTVVAVRVAIDNPNSALAPISMTWPGTEMRIPAALGSDNGAGITAYVAADGRYEFPGAEVKFARFTFGGETAFLTRNDLGAIDSTSPDEDPIAQRIAGDTEFQIVNVVEREKRVPVYDCGIRLCACGAGGFTPDLGVIVGAVVLTLRRRRKRRRATPSR